MAQSIYVAHRAPGEVRRKDSGGSWAVDFPAIDGDHVAHALAVAPDDTLFLAVQYFWGANELWKKEAGGSWTFLGNHGFMSWEGSIQAVSKDECWLTSTQHVTKWTTASGFGSTWDVQAEIGVVTFENFLLWAYGSDDILVVGSDGSTMRCATYDGVSWTQISSVVPSGSGWFASAIWADGYDVWVGIGRGVVPTTNLKLLHHAAKGVGSTWATIGAGNTNGWTGGNGFEVVTIGGIWGDISDLWVSMENDQGGPDVSRTQDNGSSWTNYTRNSGLGCNSAYGDGSGTMYFGHISSDDLSVWNGSSFSVDSTGSTGQIRGYLLGFAAGSPRGHQRIVLSAPDTLAPVLTPVGPLEDTKGVDRRTNIVLDITDEAGELTGLSVELDVDGASAWLADASQPGFSVTQMPIPDGYRFVIDPDVPFLKRSFVDVDAYAYDATGNVLDDYYSFQITANLLPSVLTINDGSGDVMAHDGYSFSPPYNGPQSGINKIRPGSLDAYDYIIHRTTPWPKGTINVDVTVDGYTIPLASRLPEPGSFDQARDSLLQFVVVEEDD